MYIINQQRERWIKSGLTHLAHEWPCTRVNWHMSGEVVMRVEHFAADWTGNLFDRPFHVLIDDLFQAVLQVYHWHPHLGLWLFLLCVVVVAAEDRFKATGIVR